MSRHEFPFESKFATVNGVRIHYVEQGRGDPVLFIHGNPTWSYLWRNIIPKVAEAHRAIAVDLLGFGKSDRPKDADYSFEEHCAVVSGFIESMALRDLSLVLHDWGGPIGMSYAIDHKENVANVVLLSTFVAPVAVALPLAFALIRQAGAGAEGGAGPDPDDEPGEVAGADAAQRTPGGGREGRPLRAGGPAGEGRGSHQRIPEGGHVA